jgi:hypothetical protein
MAEGAIYQCSRIIKIYTSSCSTKKKNYLFIWIAWCMSSDEDIQHILISREKKRLVPEASLQLKKDACFRKIRMKR